MRELLDLARMDLDRLCDIELDAFMLAQDSSVDLYDEVTQRSSPSSKPGGCRASRRGGKHVLDPTNSLFAAISQGR